ncbi:MAG TPA: DUF4142 domain-containing protein, partial [Thermosynechococcaceae cyanobacterium]
MFKLKRVMVSIALVAVGLLTSLGYSALAQAPKPVTPAPITRPATGSGTSPATGPATGAQLSPIDRAFIMDAGQANVGNLALGQLALQKATSSEVKQFAQAEIDEQKQVRADMSRILPRLGVTAPSEPAPKHQAALAQLQKLSGDRFNQAFLDEGGVNGHLEIAAVYQREAAFGQNPDLVALANKGLPIIRQHFTTASSLTNYRFAEVARRFNAVPAASGVLTNPGSTVPAPTSPAP